MTEEELKKLETAWHDECEKLRKQQGKVSKAHNKYNKARNEFYKNHEWSLQELFDMQFENVDGMYQKFNKWCEKRGFMSGGYFPETNQRTIQLLFDVKDKVRVEKQKQHLDEYLDIAILGKSGHAYIGVLEDTCAEYGVFQIVYQPELGFKFTKTTYGRTKDITPYMTKDKLFEYGLAHVKYNGERESENDDYE